MAEEQTPYADLVARQAEAAAAVHAARAELLAPALAGFGTIEQVSSTVVALRAVRDRVDVDTAMQLDRIALILTHDVVPLLASAGQA